MLSQVTSEFPDSKTYSILSASSASDKDLNSFIRCLLTLERQDEPLKHNKYTKITLVIGFKGKYHGVFHIFW